MDKIIRALYDDDPITGICVIEDINNCPQGYTPVSKTHDQDSDADLWRESYLFARRVSRYLCYSKTEGISDYIVESVGVISDKETPPDGYALIPRTIDGDSKAWKKKQVCYRLTRRSLAQTAVTDIVLLSKNKKSLAGFSLAGEISGITICYKVTTNVRPQNNGPAPALAYSLSPVANINGGPTPSHSPQVVNGVSPNVRRSVDTPSDEYVNLIRPTRPAPQVPSVQPAQTQQTTTSYGTLFSYSGLEGIPFILHPSLQNGPQISSPVPPIKAKSDAELDQEYYYDFRTERQA